MLGRGFSGGGSEIGHRFGVVCGLGFDFELAEKLGQILQLAQQQSGRPKLRALEFGAGLGLYADQLARAGATVSDVARPALDHGRAFEVYIMLLRAATAGRASAEQLDFFEQVKADTAPDDPSYVARMARAVLMPHREWLKWNNEREGMRYAWAEFFQDWDILLCPAATSAAWPHDQAGQRHDRVITVNGANQPTTDQMFWAGYPNMVNLPSTVAPAGLTPCAA